MKKIVLMSVLVFGVAPILGNAHSFYPIECCSSQDCWPMGAESDAKEPDPIAQGDYWVLSDGTRVAQSAARPSPDGRFHVCRYGGKEEGGVITPASKPVCLWAPVHGS